MAASYPTSAKTFTAIVDGVDYPQATQINQAYDEIAALEAALLTTGLAHNLTLTPASAVLTFSGATAPEILFSGANGRVASNASLIFQVDKDNNGAESWLFRNGAGTDIAQLSEAGLMCINDSSNAKTTIGLTINQAGNDDEILSLKSSDVAHGVTDLTETDTWGFVRKIDANGGILAHGVNVIQTFALMLKGTAGAAATTRTTAARAVIELDSSIKSGTGIASCGGDTNLLSVADNGTRRFFLDSDGDSHQDVGTAWTNFDDGDDLARLDAVAVALAREGDPLRGAFVRSFENQRAVIEAMPGKPLVTFNEDGHHFVNMSRLTMLLTGGVRQLARQQAQLAKALVAAGVVSQAQLEAA